MKWKELDYLKLTWNDFELLSWAGISEDKYTMLQKLWNGELSLSPEVETKLIGLCKPFIEEYQKHYVKKFNLRDTLSSLSKFLQFLINLHTLQEAYGQELQTLLEKVLDFLFSQLE